ncbi:hypothetical protein CJ030_MR8G005085 [Morella rubra]|uniref:Uncharacterized protein n=1 Tax=Morella rubra TaxID=262757 RepID=A0A6A1UU87_9ROSI|nr:hypothetical protein CJ030_MR8G005085 [Morella rubra]
MEVPVISLVSSSEEEAATSVRQRKQEEEYRLISDLAGFDILRDVIEAQALLRAKRRERKKPKKKQAGQDYFVGKGRGSPGKGHLEKHQEAANPNADICLRCGGEEHSMFSCRSAYSPDDLKWKGAFQTDSWNPSSVWLLYSRYCGQEMKCYVCNNFGHLCCADFPDMGPREVSCCSCGQSGHLGSNLEKLDRLSHARDSGRARDGVYNAEPEVGRCILGMLDLVVQLGGGGCSSVLSIITFVLNS